MPTGEDLYQNREQYPLATMRGEMKNYRIFIPGHWYEWTLPPSYSLPHASFEMFHIFDRKYHLCTGYRNHCITQEANAVGFDSITGAWFWGHLAHHFIDRGTRIESTSDCPINPPKKGDVINITLPGLSHPLRVLVMDNKRKAPVRLVMVDGQSAMVASHLLTSNERM